MVSTFYFSQLYVVIKYELGIVHYEYNLLASNGTDNEHFPFLVHITDTGMLDTFYWQHCIFCNQINYYTCINKMSLVNCT